MRSYDRHLLEVRPWLNVTPDPQQVQAEPALFIHLMLVATRNLVELDRSRRRLGGVATLTPVEGPISFNGGRERRSLVEQKVDVCFLLRSGRLVLVIFV